MWGIINDENVSRDRPRRCKGVFFAVIRMLLAMKYSQVVASGIICLRLAGQSKGLNGALNWNVHGFKHVPNNVLQPEGNSILNRLGNNFCSVEHGNHLFNEEIG
nr:hypothetical protein [Paenibacillus sp. YN15]